MSRKPETATRKPFGPVLAVAATVAVLGAVIAGVMFIDSPSIERSQRLDATRVADLERIASAIDCYWTLSGDLPADLATLVARMNEELVKRPIADSCTPRSIVDPESGVPYRYRAIEGADFELCAAFVAPLADKRQIRFYDYPRDHRRSWLHGAGPHCFRPTALTIDSSIVPR